jgi:hypothetical protein
MQVFIEQAQQLSFENEYIIEKLKEHGVTVIPINYTLGLSIDVGTIPKSINTPDLINRLRTEAKEVINKII